MSGQPMSFDERGFVYFIEAGDFVKIGWCRHHPKGRLAILQTGCPFPMRLLTCRWGSLNTERKIHAKLRDHHYRGEWFHLNDAVRAYIGPGAKSKTEPTNTSPNTVEFVCAI